MGSSLNKVFVMGNLGKDPVLRKTQTDKSVCSFPVAATDKFGENEHTEWFNVVVWGNQADSCAKYLEKGRACLIEGRLQTRTWEGSEGDKKYTTEVIANRVQFIGSGQQQERREDPPTPDEPRSFGGPETPGVDEIPF